MRHLLQLVAVKRRQAEGRTLAEIQAELTGATDATLRRIAALPAAPSAALPKEAPPAAPPKEAPPAAPPKEAPATRTRFWADRPTPAAATEPRPAMEPRAATDPPQPPELPETPETLTGVPLAGGALLLVPGRPGPADLTAIHAAAQPLLDLLAARGLLNDRSPR